MTQERQYSEEEKLVLTLEEIAKTTDSEERREELNDIKQKILIRQQIINLDEK
jgi:hypothetical protein